MTIRGIAYPFNKGTTSFPAKQTDDEVIADNIARIIVTPRGTRVMRRDLGSDCHTFVFENTGPILQGLMDAEIRRAVSENEPRARIILVEINEQESQDGDMQVIVDVTYEALGTVNNVTTTIPKVSG